MKVINNSILIDFSKQNIQEEIDENDLLILLNETELSRSFDRHSKFTIDHCKLLIAAIAHVNPSFEIPHQSISF